VRLRHRAGGALPRRDLRRVRRPRRVATGSTVRRLTARLVALVVDADDPPSLARFWAEALGWDVDDHDASALVPTDGTRFRVVFRPSSGTKVGRNRIHLDLTTASLDDQRDSVARLLAAGAQHLDVGQTPDEPHVVLADPEGNELCLIEPGNSFLAGCGRLGALSCDGSRAVGEFWSRAFDWPLIWDEGEETAIRAPDGTGPIISWGGGPELPKLAKPRLHLDIAPTDGSDQAMEVDRLCSLGATPVDIGQGEVDWIVLADPDGNEFCVLRS
jgi:predicted enzyme related to lactoylglutathione lyase